MAFDIAARAASVRAGVTSDTAELAIHSTCRWPKRTGRERYPRASESTNTADCGDWSGAHVLRSKFELQKLADATPEPSAAAAHGSSRHGGNDRRDHYRIERRVRQRLFRKGIKIRNAQLRALDITDAPFHPE